MKNNSKSYYVVFSPEELGDGVRLFYSKNEALEDCAEEIGEDRRREYYVAKIVAHCSAKKIQVEVKTDDEIDLD